MTKTKPSDDQAQNQRVNWQRFLRNLGAIATSAGVVTINPPVAIAGYLLWIGSDRELMKYWRSSEAGQRARAALATEQAVRGELVRWQLNASDARVKLWARAVLAYALYTFDPDEYGKKLAANQL